MTEAPWRNGLRTKEAPSRPVPILLYHSVSADRSGLMGRYTTHPGAFRAHMAWVATSGFDTMTASSYAAALRGEVALPARPLVVTFDDGYADFLAEAAPVLGEYGIRATLYVTTRPVGQRRRGTLAGRAMLTWSELCEVAALGVEIGGHSHDHAQLDVLSRRDALRQASTCKDLLEEHLQVPVRSFAYPHGYNSARTRAAVRAAGYSSACAVKNARSHELDDPWALARVMFEHADGVDRLRQACEGEADPLARRGDTARAKGWRAARRLRARVRPDTLTPPTTPGS